jgi:ABC-type sulfate transport system permease subunit
VIGTVPRVGALERLAGRVRAKPWMALALVAGLLLVAAWLGWTIYIAADRGVREGLGVLVAWPALVVAAALVSLPFVGLYLLIRQRSANSAPANEVGASKDSEPQETEQAEATETG